VSDHILEDCFWGFLFVLSGLLAGNFLTGCAHAPPRAPVAVPELVQGLRPEPTCVAAPRVYEGTFYRFDQTCLFTKGGPAACQYMARMDLGRSWLCAVAQLQADCAAPWEPIGWHCIPWDDQYENLIRDLHSAAEEVLP
jgi:hypothetical protein